MKNLHGQVFIRLRRRRWHEACPAGVGEKMRIIALSLSSLLLAHAGELRAPGRARAFPRGLVPSRNRLGLSRPADRSHRFRSVFRRAEPPTLARSRLPAHRRPLRVARDDRAGGPRGEHGVRRLPGTGRRAALRRPEDGRGPQLDRADARRVRPSQITRFASARGAGWGPDRRFTQAPSASFAT